MGLRMEDNAHLDCTASQHRLSCCGEGGGLHEDGPGNGHLRLPRHRRGLLRGARQGAHVREAEGHGSKQRFAHCRAAKDICKEKNVAQLMGTRWLNSSSMAILESAQPSSSPPLPQPRGQANTTLDTAPVSPRTAPGHMRMHLMVLFSTDIPRPSKEQR